ncbi:putative fatty acyl-CoA reductase CG5065 [Parasteatoda tepidariorum]|uniref:Fatty acyl-CoA reductase n=1 Tax=Parasteatoda tepidariorum TaxID=114398 RepID=A0A2L2YHA0_PARTP|nr:putative fatty acyl-CoA reductase CG5065 [Parasteatoda tepidariorum]XP_042907022.1 putative fatty acyl-CoA reductase CG5065 [Parasteatoda tepidariorum]XP_042907023.1 putative fatty acyl-CoA reductase CG5065 [Parasteatoda tepidariorum]XP_042907025.1 putative fatty acyl-CoA reductase CG5065 [Parasteatoda tepidariorum]XP_042907026.1 putative fatty acyl-CoA reductase CG5065 [Parasteatoda tepidariorum]XP_042907027.1 putative fatty acyl-CoA reductase CG5065 [Parasteatoda tepidariorum]
MAESSSSNIASFYADRSILITGATGFMGKVLVEKLLRSCHSVKTIYVLLRPKKGQEPKQRLEELLQAKVFERLKKEQPNSVSKLIAIHGDLTLPGLGISSSDQLLLTTDVSIVFHSAATVKFDEKLKRSVDMNVLGTRRLVELCHKMEHLEALVHVSTAYCNCDREQVDEVVYEPPVQPQKIIDTIEWMDEELVNVLTPHLLRGRPNTYTYTKALAETLLVEESGALPVAIVRPSIVTAAWKEPFPGWVDNFNGPTGLIVATSKGILRSMHCKSSSIADLIPVDVVINLVITVAWYTASHRPNSILVYNCSSGSTNKLTWGTVERLAIPLILRHPSHEVYFYPNGSFTNSKLWNYLSVLLYHHIPAYLIDFVAVLTGHKPKLIPIYKKLHRAIQCLEYFTTHEWTFNSSNVSNLLEKLSPQDKKEFNFDIESLHWPTYIEEYILGIRQFLLKEDLSSLPSARKSLKRIYLYTKMGHALLLFFLWKTVFMRYNGARKLWFIFLSMMVKVYNILPKAFLTS